MRVSSTSPIHAEDGAALIQVAVAILVLAGFCAFVLDQGVMLLARAQAQNAADAGALAGAIARAFDETTDPPAAGGLAETSARLAAQANQVGDASGTASVNVLWTCPTFATAARCARVDVFRDGTNGSTPLQAYFANLFGITSQRASASAVAWATGANSTNCLRPFGVVDNWIENGPATNNLVGEFDSWIKVGNNASKVMTPDTYVPPNATSTGTGYTVQASLGAEVLLKGGNNPNSSAGAVSPGWFLPLQLPDGNGGYVSGANDYSNAIGTCTGAIVTIGQYLPTETGAMVGPTSQGVDALVAQDPNATWDISSQAVINSCAPGCAAFSPRIVPIAVLDIDEFQWRSDANDWTTPWIPGQGAQAGQPGSGSSFSCPIGGRCVRVTNILGFFVEGMSGGQDVHGRIVILPGEFATSGTGLTGGASFMTAIQLIR